MKNEPKDLYAKAQLLQEAAQEAGRVVGGIKESGNAVVVILDGKEILVNKKPMSHIYQSAGLKM